MKKIIIALAVVSIFFLAQPVYALGQVNTGNQINVLNYRASGSNQVTIGNISKGSNTLTLSAPIDFKNGEGISIANAGPLPTISAPSSITVIPSKTTGSTSYTYAIAAIDDGGGVTSAFSASTLTGKTSLSKTNYNFLTVSPVTDATSYAVWRVSTSGSEPKGFICLFAVDSNTFQDNGLPVIKPPLGIPALPPTSALGDTLVTAITSGAGSDHLSLATTASSTVTFAMVRHDDVSAIQAAINAAGSVAGVVYIPSGTYYGTMNAFLTVPANITVAGVSQNIPILTDIGFRISSANVTVENLLETNCAESYIVFWIRDGASNINFKNVTVSNSVTAYMAAAFYIRANQGINGIIFANCTASNIPGSGFATIGSGKIQNVQYTNCVATKCGYATQFNPWAVGFDMGESGVTLNNISFVNCVASFNWESGFHEEFHSPYSDVIYQNCSSHDNAQKPSPTYGFGFIVVGGTDAIGSESWNNYCGFYVNSLSVLKGCKSWENSDTGFDVT